MRNKVHGNKGKVFSEEHKLKLSKAHKGKTSNNKGIVKSFTYGAIHHWSQRYIELKDNCEFCDKSNCRLERANINHEYNRVMEDWTTLCVSCHRIYDIQNHGYRGWA